MQLDGLKLVHNGNAGPTELLDGDEGLVEVLVLGDEVRADVNGESLGTEDVGGGLREVCAEMQPLSESPYMSMHECDTHSR